MKKLFLIDGAMRPAKTEVVEYLKGLSATFHGGELSTNFLVTKFSTREYEAGENEDNQDFKHDSELDKKIEECPIDWISYSYSKNIYAVKVDTLKEAIEKHENVFLIVRSTELIKELKKQYEMNGVKVVPVYIYSDKKTIAEAYHKNSDELSKRKEKMKISDSDYENAMAQSANVYDEVIIYSAQNGTGSASIKTKLFGLIKKYDEVLETNSIFVIHSYKDRQIAEELFKAIKDSSQSLKPKARCDSLLYGSGSYVISDTVYESIEKNDYIICDITPDRCDGSDKPIEGSQGVSPNIWIELGYTLATLNRRGVMPGRKLIITCKSKDKDCRLPVDIQGYNIMTYFEFDELRAKLLEHFKKQNDDLLSRDCI